MAIDSISRRDTQLSFAIPLPAQGALYALARPQRPDKAFEQWSTKDKKAWEAAAALSQSAHCISRFPGGVVTRGLWWLAEEPIPLQASVAPW